MADKIVIGSSSVLATAASIPGTRALSVRTAALIPMSREASPRMAACSVIGASGFPWIDAVIESISWSVLAKTARILGASSLVELFGLGASYTHGASLTHQPYGFIRPS